MPEEILVRHCSPTLAGIKTGSLFTCAFTDTDELKASLRRWNSTLGAKGLRAIPMRWSAGRALIYLYRPGRLDNDLNREKASRILSQRGYCPGCPGKCLAELMRRLRQREDFPHEIGLFLGYPPEDVEGFIENRECCKCTGCWKVYGDVEAAQKTFAKYKKCTNVYCGLYAQGRSIEKLTVAS